MKNTHQNNFQLNKIRVRGQFYLVLGGDIVSRMRISDDTFILKRNRNYTYHNEFPFLLERKRNHIEYYRCVQRYASKCKARLVIKRHNHGNDQTVQLKEHNHDPSKGTHWYHSIESTQIQNKLNILLICLVFFSLLFSISFQTANPFCTSSIKAIYFLSITKLVKKPIGVVHNWLDIVNDVRLDLLPVLASMKKSLKKDAMNMAHHPHKNKTKIIAHFACKNSERKLKKKTKRLKWNKQHAAMYYCLVLNLF